MGLGFNGFRVLRLYGRVQGPRVQGFRVLGFSALGFNGF